MKNVYILWLFFTALFLKGQNAQMSTLPNKIVKEDDIKNMNYYLEKSSGGIKLLIEVVRERLDKLEGETNKMNDKLTQFNKSLDTIKDHLDDIKKERQKGEAFLKDDFNYLIKEYEALMKMFNGIRNNVEKEHKNMELEIKEEHRKLQKAKTKEIEKEKLKEAHKKIEDSIAENNQNIRNNIKAKIKEYDSFLNFTKEEIKKGFNYEIRTILGDRIKDMKAIIDRILLKR